MNNYFYLKHGKLLSYFYNMLDFDIELTCFFFTSQMSRKGNENFHVVYLTHNLPEECAKIIVAPSAYLKDDMVTFLPFPLSEEDQELWDSFIKKFPTPPAPETWVKYTAVVLASFGNNDYIFSFFIFLY